MSKGLVFYIDEAGSDGAAAEAVRMTLENSSIQIEKADDLSSGIVKLKHLVSENAAPQVVILGPAVKSTGAAARQVHQILPHSQIILLGGDERGAAAHNALTLASVPGTHWTSAVATDPASLLSAIKTSLQVAAQRKSLRTTLDRINLTLASPTQTDGADIRKLVISDRYMASILEQVRDPVISTDLQGKIISVNRAAVDTFGHDDLSLPGESVEKLISADGRNQLREAIREVRAAGAEHKLELIGCRSDSSPFDLELNIGPVKDETGSQLIGMVFIGHDITDHKKRQRELADLLRSERDARRLADEANRIKDEFLATVSHELRTPLNAIQGWASMAVSGSLTGQALDKALNTILRNARAQGQLISDLLDVSRIIAGNLRLDVKPVDPNSFIDAAIEAVRPAAEAKGIRLQKIIDTGLPMIHGDATRLQQVVWNLVANAVKFTPKNGRVVVTLHRINSHIEIVVCDTGEGIEPEFLPFVFDRFRQADSASTRKHGGLGLGLAIVRHLVELHGGTVRVESEGKNKGATFTVALPLIPVYRRITEQERVHPTSDEAYTSEEVLPELRGIDVLIVDDERDSLELLDTVFRRSGANVGTAASAKDALRLLAEQRFSILISDIGMPEEDGYSLIRKVRNSADPAVKSIAAVALTAYARPQDRLKALQAGFQMHVPKPVEISELLTVVGSLTNRLPATDVDGRSG